METPTEDVSVDEETDSSAEPAPKVGLWQRLKNVEQQFVEGGTAGRSDDDAALARLLNTWVFFVFPVAVIYSAVFAIERRFISLACFLPAVIMLVVVGVMVRFGRSVRLAANLLPLTWAVVFVLSAILANGMTTSMSIQALYLIPLIAANLLGARAAWWWMLAAAGCFAVVYGVEYVLGFYIAPEVIQPPVYDLVTQWVFLAILTYFTFSARKIVERQMDTLKQREQEIGDLAFELALAKQEEDADVEASRQKVAELQQTVHQSADDVRNAIEKVLMMRLDPETRHRFESVRASTETFITAVDGLVTAESKH